MKVSFRGSYLMQFKNFRIRCEAARLFQNKNEKYQDFIFNVDKDKLLLINGNDAQDIRKLENLNKVKDIDGRHKGIYCGILEDSVRDGYLQSAIKLDLRAYNASELFCRANCENC